LPETVVDVVPWRQTFSFRRPAAPAYNRPGTLFVVAGSCSGVEKGMARRDGKKAPNGAGSEWYDPGRGLYFAAYTRGLRPNGTPDFKAALRRSDLPDFSPYVFFRHAHVTITLASDVAIQDVAKRTGHTVKVLERVYAHRVASRDREAARRFERATSRAAPDPEAGARQPAGAR
jgi:hypothetical protein